MIGRRRTRFRGLFTYKEYPPYLINCRHFVAVLGDKGCYVKCLEGTKVIVFRYELGRASNKNDGLGRPGANS